RDLAVVLDIDMSILGEPWERYRRYADGVRAEYVPAAVSARRFAAGRMMFLSRLLGGGAIFHTPEGADRWERAARQNVARELEDLRRGAAFFSRLMARVIFRRRAS
ncbi:MAG TPA: hypothetical protein VFA36_10670, partial [Burkholderiales bacterium]|nr:hypothetical protein [Burkholderiales bacterium]